MRYFLNNNGDIVHEVDDEGRSREECNLDDARKAGHLTEIAREGGDDARQAAVKELIDRGCRRCQHCMAC